MVDRTQNRTRSAAPTTAQPAVISNSPVLQTKKQPNHKLTYKQDLFAMLISQGKTQTEAYKQAYGCENMKPASIHAVASRLAGNAMVVSRVEELKSKQLSVNLHDVLFLRQTALETLYEIATKQQAKDSDRNRAAELLGKVRGVELFGDTPEQQANAKSAAISDIERKIRALLVKPDAQPIDIVEVHDLEPKADAAPATHSQTDDDPA